MASSGQYDDDGSTRVTIVGSNVTGGGANSPVVVGGQYNTTLPTPVAGTSVAIQSASDGSPRALLVGINVTPADAQTNVESDITTVGSAAGTRRMGVFPYYYNGTTWDRMRGNVNGQFNIPPTNDQWSYAAATGGIVNTTTAVTVKTAAGASLRNYVQNIQLSWDSLGAATEVAIRDGAAGTVLWRYKIQTSSAGSFSTNVFLKGTANTLLEVVTLTASVTGGVFVNLQGFTGP